MAMDEEHMVRYRLSNRSCGRNCDSSVLNVYLIGSLEFLA